MSRPRARLARLGPARLAVSVPRSMLALAFLVGISLALRSQAIHARFWIDEGLSVGIASHPLSAIPGVALRSKTTAGSRYAVPDIKGLGGEDAVQTFAISGGWRIVGNCG